MVGVKYIASVSFGKDSLAMLLRLIEEDWPLDAIVFYDTGMEFEAIYKIRDKVKVVLDAREIEYVELHPEEAFIYLMLDRKVKYRNKEGYHYGYGWCGGNCRWGTTQKLKAIKKYKSTILDNVIDYVGIAADESDRFERAKQEGKRLPLVEWGMTEADCLQFCHEKGYYWLERSFGTGIDCIDLYDILDRVSCWCCSNKNLKELRNVYHYLPQYWSKLSYLQGRIDRPFKGTYRGNPNGIFELEKRFEKEDSDDV